jgi:Tfp pilus assembly protein PilN
METKEHIFLFLVPLTLTIALFTLLDSNSLRRKDLSRRMTILAILAALIGLAVGALGFMVPAPKAPRREQFGGELDKLKRYLAKGDHIAPEAVLEYMNCRAE